MRRIIVVISLLGLCACTAAPAPTPRFSSASGGRPCPDRPVEQHCVMWVEPGTQMQPEKALEPW